MDLFDLPVEIVLRILSFCESATLLNLMQTCKAMNEYCHDDCVWRGTYWVHISNEIESFGGGPHFGLDGHEDPEVKKDFFLELARQYQPQDICNHQCWTIRGAIFILCEVR